MAQQIFPLATQTIFATDRDFPALLNPPGVSTFVLDTVLHIARSLSNGPNGPKNGSNGPNGPKNGSNGPNGPKNGSNGSNGPKNG